MKAKYAKGMKRRLVEWVPDTPLPEFQTFCRLSNSEHGMTMCDWVFLDPLSLFEDVDPSPVWGDRGAKEGIRSWLQQEDGCKALMQEFGMYLLSVFETFEHCHWSVDHPEGVRSRFVAQRHNHRHDHTGQKPPSMDTLKKSEQSSDNSTPELDIPLVWDLEGLIVLLVFAFLVDCVGSSTSDHLETSRRSAEEEKKEEASLPAAVAKSRSYSFLARATWLQLCHRLTSLALYCSSRLELSYHFSYFS